MTGKPVCGGHDPETRLKAQRAGGKATARERRSAYLTPTEAIAAVVFTTRSTIKDSLEALSRHAVSGKLDTRAVNATILAANAALQIINDEEKSAPRRAAMMTDEELDSALEDEFSEWRLRREVNQ